MSAPILRDGMLADLLVRCLKPRWTAQLATELNWSVERVMEVAYRAYGRTLVQPSERDRVVLTPEGRAAVAQYVSTAILEQRVPAKRMAEIMALSVECERGDPAALDEAVKMLLAVSERRVAA